MPIQRPATIQLRTSLFEDASDIVGAEFGSDLSLDEIARRVASSRRQLQRAYTEIGHTTFREHLTAVRMRKAAEMLERRELTVREVANRVGYRQPAQFAKAFRRAHGMAPSAYRLCSPIDRAGGGSGGAPGGALPEGLRDQRVAASPLI
jgi:AraC-like DNA-binding protein